MKIYKTLYILLFFICLSVTAQDKNDLVRKKNATLKEIETASALLSNVKKTKLNTLYKLTLYSEKINLRTRLIDNISEEIQSTDSRIIEKEFIIDMIKEDFNKLSDNYGNLLNHYYFSNKYTKSLYFILSSENFNQAYKRLKYLKQFSEYRQKQLYTLKQLNKIIQSELNQLQNIKNDKKVLLSNKETEVKNLVDEVEETKKIVTSLKSQESILKKQLAEKKKIAERIDKELERIISDEAKKIAKSNIAPTPEQTLLSTNFEKNKGRLPWPTEKGIITGHYGKHNHPFIKGVIVNNNGIDITSTKGANARTVFSGIVSKVFAIKGANYTVLIKHGSYYTVYQNLINVNVKAGQKVNVKDYIGEIYYNTDENSTILHFEVWMALERMNPRDWLTNK